MLADVKDEAVTANPLECVAIRDECVVDHDTREAENVQR